MIIDRRVVRSPEFAQATPAQRCNPTFTRGLFDQFARDKLNLGWWLWPLRNVLDLSGILGPPPDDKLVPLQQNQQQYLRKKFTESMELVFRSCVDVNPPPQPVKQWPTLVTMDQVYAEFETLVSKDELRPFHDAVHLEDYFVCTTPTKKSKDHPDLPRPNTNPNLSLATVFGPPAQLLP